MAGSSQRIDENELDFDASIDTDLSIQHDLKEIKSLTKKTIAQCNEKQNMMRNLRKVIKLVRAEVQEYVQDDVSGKIVKKKK